MAEKERSYTTWMPVKAGDKMVVYMEGYVRKNRNGNTLEIRNVEGQNGPLKVADVLISVILGDRTAENLLGYVNKEYGSYFVRVSLFGQAAERIQKYDPNEKQRLGFQGFLKVSEYEGKNGKARSLNLTANDFKVCVGKHTAQGSDAVGNQAGRDQTSTSQKAAEAAQKNAPADSDYMDGFELYEDELPFD